MNFHPYGIVLHFPEGDMILNAGANMQIQPQGNLITFSAQIPNNVVTNGVTAWEPPAISDTNAPTNSVYFSTTANKLVYKDASSVIHNLY